MHFHRVRTYLIRSPLALRWKRKAGISSKATFIFTRSAYLRLICSPPREDCADWTNGRTGG